MNLLIATVLLAATCLQAPQQEGKDLPSAKPEAAESISAPTIEIEQKFEVLDETALAPFLASIKPDGTIHTIDSYLDTTDAALLNRGIWIRIRDTKKLEFKFNQACIDNPTLGMQSYCEEHAFTLPFTATDTDRLNALNTRLNLVPINQADFDGYLQANKLSPHRIIDKMRTTYQIDDFSIMIDVVANLGTFLEIELMACSAENVTAVEQRMALLLAGLPLKRVKTSYDTLLLRKQNFDVYLKSRFVLEEDKAPQPCSIEPSPII